MTQVSKVYISQAWIGHNQSQQSRAFIEDLHRGQLGQEFQRDHPGVKFVIQDDIAQGDTGAQHTFSVHPTEGIPGADW